MPDRYTGTPSRDTACASDRPIRRAPPPGCRSPSTAARPWSVHQRRVRGSVGRARQVHRLHARHRTSWLPANMRLAWRFRYQRSARSAASCPCPPASAYHWRIEASSYSRSTGHSMNTGPGTPERASANASATAGPRSRTRRILKKRLTCGSTSGRWSMSCSAPRPCSAVGAAPPSSTTGLCASCAFFSAVIVLVMPGPAVTAATPGTPVSRAVASAANTAVTSSRTSTTRMPRALAALENRRDVAAAQREQALHAVRLQRLGDAVAAVARGDVARGHCSVTPTARARGRRTSRRPAAPPRPRCGRA